MTEGLTEDDEPEIGLTGFPSFKLKSRQKNDWHVTAASCTMTFKDFYVPRSHSVCMQSLSLKEISKDLISLKTISNQVIIVHPQQIDLSVLVNAASTSALQQSLDRLM
jgi:hypothetical protein